MAIVQCINCDNFRFKDDIGKIVAMSNIGCGNCKHDKPHTYYGADKERECDMFKLAAQATIDKRINFIKSIEMNGK